MAGTVVNYDNVAQSVRQIRFDWLTDASGDATDATDAYLDGQVLRVEFVPDTGGTAPSDQYDVTLTTADSIDLLYGQGANLSGTNTVAVVSNLGCVANSKISLTVANGGNAKGGNVYIYIR